MFLPFYGNRSNQLEVDIEAYLEVWYAWYAYLWLSDVGTPKTVLKQRVKRQNSYIWGVSGGHREWSLFPLLRPKAKPVNNALASLCQPLNRKKIKLIGNEDWSSQI